MFNKSNFCPKKNQPNLESELFEISDFASIMIFGEFKNYWNSVHIVLAKISFISHKWAKNCCCTLIWLVVALE